MQNGSGKDGKQNSARAARNVAALGGMIAIVTGAAACDWRAGAIALGSLLLAGAVTGMILGGRGPT